jgi:mannosylglucosylglycerate synthase
MAPITAPPSIDPGVGIILPQALVFNAPAVVLSSGTMRIGIIIGRIGGVDGVALETEKWITVLGRMGHQVYVLAGELEAPVAADGVDVQPLLAFSSPECAWEQGHAFLGGGASEGEILDRVAQAADRIAAAALAWLERRRVDQLIIENASALPFHLSMGVALREVVRRSRVPTLTHDHDFAWERGERYVSPHAAVNRQVAACFPLALPGVRHAVINRAARAALQERLGVEATVVPNVMDFEAPYARRDAYNDGLPAALGASPGDTLIFQVTRVVRRKGVEVAIQLLSRLPDERARLVVTGDATDEPDGAYQRELEALVARLGLGARVHFAGPLFATERGRGPNGARIYGLSDAYAQATACTFFSTYEGFGNAFVECALARRPIFVNNYRPVYEPDIGSKGFRTVQIEDQELTDEAVVAASAVLNDPALAAEWAEHNFALGREHFSFDVLERLLGELLSGG